MKDSLYRVEFAIDVSAPNPETACQRAWQLLSGPGAMLPVGTAINEHGDQDTLDLQQLAETSPM
jgi:hypothetical protein